MSHEKFTYTSVTDNLEVACSSNQTNNFHAVVEGSIEFGISIDGWIDLADRLARGLISKLTIKNISGGPSNLSQILQSATSLHEVEFDASIFPFALQYEIISALQNQKQLTSLSIENYDEISGEYLKGIATVIKKSTSLNTLKLNNLNINDNAHFESICIAIANSTTLEKLDLNNLNLTENNQKNVTNSLSDNTSIVELISDDETLKQIGTSKSVEAYSKNHKTKSIVRGASFFSSEHVFLTTFEQQTQPVAEKKSSCCVMM